MVPRTKELNSLGGDLFFFEEGFEEFLAEEFFKWREVEVIGGRVKDPIAGEESKGRKGMTVRVKICERSKGLRRGDHGRDGFLKRGELCLEELKRGGISRAAKIPVEVTVPEELTAEHLRDGENQGHVRDVGKDIVDHSLGPEQSSLLAARAA